MSKKTKDTTVDIDYADQAVPKEGRKGFLTMFMIMLGFTFFSASIAHRDLTARCFQHVHKAEYD